MPPRGLDYGLGPEVYALDPSFEAIGWPNEQGVARAVLFRADAEPFISRRNTRVMLFVLKRRPALVSVLPDVILSEQSEYSTWEDKSVSPMPILTTAEYMMNFDAGETHFGKHYYYLATYIWNASVLRYEGMDSFTTSSRYPGFDDVEKIQVIRHELAGIKGRLRNVLAPPR